MSRRPLIIGNWKLFPSHKKSLDLAQAVRQGLQSDTANRIADVDVVLAPVATALSAIRECLIGSSVELAAQDCFWENQGAYTGEVSAAALVEIGCQWVILGHSERRQYFHESDADVAKKARAALREGLNPIICVGESLEERQAHMTWKRVEAQITAALAEVDSVERVVIAYEPIWAIGTGKTAQPHDAQEVHAQLRTWLAQRYTASVAQRVRIVYGGSVKSDNAQSLLEASDVDGALVGGASLDSLAFLSIVKSAHAASRAQ